MLSVSNLSVQFGKRVLFGRGKDIVNNGNFYETIALR